MWVLGSVQSFVPSTRLKNVLVAIGLSRVKRRQEMLPRVVSRMAVGPDGSGPDGGGKGMIGCAGRIALDATRGACGGDGLPGGAVAMGLVANGVSGGWVVL